jgi:hypothetical protein
MGGREGGGSGRRRKEERKWTKLNIDGRNVLSMMNN